MCLRVLVAALALSSALAPAPAPVPAPKPADVPRPMPARKTCGCEWYYVEFEGVYYKVWKDCTCSPDCGCP
jgi:hypothetical protein